MELSKAASVQVLRKASFHQYGTPLGDTEDVARFTITRTTPRT
ncbi:hypothetical protein [Streptomyces sp. NPDC056492]